MWTYAIHWSGQLKVQKEVRHHLEVLRLGQDEIFFCICNSSHKPVRHRFGGGPNFGGKITFLLGAHVLTRTGFTIRYELVICLVICTSASPRQSDKPLHLRPLSSRCCLSLGSPDVPLSAVLRCVGAETKFKSNDNIP